MKAVVMAAPDKPGSDPDEPDRGPAGARDKAHAVETVVTFENGQWAVDIIVLFDDEVVRQRIDVYRSERLARISADLIKRTAERDISGPLNG